MKLLDTQLNIEDIERKLMSDIEHLNVIEVKKTKIILTFDSKEIEIC